MLRSLAGALRKSTWFSGYQGAVGECFDHHLAFKQLFRPRVPRLAGFLLPHKKEFLMSIISVRPLGEHWAVAALSSAQAIKFGKFPSRAEAIKAARDIARILGAEFRP